jgi:hypothetical protein
MEIDISYRQRLVNRTFQTVHILIAFGFLIFGLVEFVSNPPYFDGYGPDCILCRARGTYSARIFYTLRAFRPKMRAF